MSRAPLFVAAAAIAAGLAAPHVLPGGGAAQLQSESSYPDVDAFSIEANATSYLRERNIMIGLPDGTFGGGRPLNRAEMTKIIMISAQKRVFAGRNAGIFRDVEDGQWYTNYVMNAAIQGIVSGYPDRTFRPAATINTVEFLKLLSETFDLPEFSPHDYVDVSPSDWFNRYAGTAQTYNLFPSRDRLHLDPAALITRRDAAIALYQYLRVSGKGPNPILPSSSSKAASSSSSSSSAAISSSASSEEETIILRASSSSRQASSGCYFPPSPPKGCLYVCEKNVLCLKESQCQLACASSSGG